MAEYSSNHCPSLGLYVFLHNDDNDTHSIVILQDKLGQLAPEYSVLDFTGAKDDVTRLLLETWREAEH